MDLVVVCYPIQLSLLYHGNNYGITAVPGGLAPPQLWLYMHLLHPQVSPPPQYVHYLLYSPHRLVASISGGYCVINGQTRFGAIFI